MDVASLYELILCRTKAMLHKGHVTRTACTSGTMLQTLRASSSLEARCPLQRWGGDRSTPSISGTGGGGFCDRETSTSGSTTARTYEEQNGRCPGSICVSHVVASAHFELVHTGFVLQVEVEMIRTLDDSRDRCLLTPTG